MILRRAIRLLSLLAILGLTAASAPAQIASSANYRLDGIAFAGGGGGIASPSFSAQAALAPLTGERMATASYGAELGVLGVFDPVVSSVPVVFGVTPDCGPVAGGTSTVVSGLHFQALGAGPTITVSVGGAAASGVTVLSDTQLTMQTPAGASGPKDVAVTSLHGTGSLANGFTYSDAVASYGTGTPGCAGPQAMGFVSCPTLGNAAFALTCSAAPPSSLGLGLLTDAPDIAGSDPFGLGVLLHVDLFGALEVNALDVVSDAAGLGTVATPVPNLPSLAGKHYYMQVLWAWSSCALPPYGLSTSNALDIRIDP